MNGALALKWICCPFEPVVSCVSLLSVGWLAELPYLSAYGGEVKRWRGIKSVSSTLEFLAAFLAHF